MLTVESTSKIELKDFEGIVSEEQLQTIRELSNQLKTKKIAHVNSTSFGGGVAEILHSMVPLMRGVGLKVNWQVINGDLNFFNITKKIHNALQGANLVLSKEEEHTYLEYTRMNSDAAVLDADIVMVHDAQPVALIKFCRNKSNCWIWRCHIDLSTPNFEVWRFLEPYISQYNAAVFTAKEYVIHSLMVSTLAIRAPSINPLNEKNRELTEPEIRTILERFNVNPEKPVITQVGRFDRWKNPTGAIDVYRLLKKQYPNVQLVLIGGMATDDPEGQYYFEKTLQHARGDPDIHLLLTDHKSIKDVEVNAFQRASRVVLQMSTKEGFGLTVTEALWKGVPVVARRVGGIPLQVINGQNGFLIDTVERAAEKTLYLLKNQETAKQMGVNGKELVRKKYLIISHLKDYLSLFNDLLKRQK
ncbi:MAG: glycosyltransferase [Candidatus Bathyarchaeia archaeon]|jgi:trehalose synthase